MKYLIDTNICIYIINKRPVEVIKKFKPFEPGEIGVYTITVSEIRYGVAKSANQKLNELRLEEFLAPLDILTYDQSAAKVYGDIRFRLEKLGQPIGGLDLLMAAQALSRDLVLITNNEKEFKRIKTLKTENWAK